MRAIGEPDAHSMNEFARRDRRRMADDHDEIALPARLHLQDREAILLVVKGHPLDGADERFTGRSSVGGGLQDSMPLLEADEQIISDYPSTRFQRGRDPESGPPCRMASISPSIPAARKVKRPRSGRGSLT